MIVASAKSSSGARWHSRHDGWQYFRAILRLFDAVCCYPRRLPVEELDRDHLYWCGSYVFRQESLVWVCSF